MSSTPASVSRNFAILSAGQTLSRLVAFAMTIYLTRTLLAEGFGVVVFAMGVLEYAGLVVNFGFDFLGPVEVARGRIALPTLVRTILGLRLVLAVVGFSSLAVFASLAPLPDLTKVVLLWYGLSLATTAFDLRWVFLGAESMGPATLGEVIPQGLQALGAVLLVHGPEDVMRMPFLFLGGQLASNGVLVALFVRRYGRLALVPDVAVLRTLLPAALPLGAAAAVGVVLHNFDIVLLGLWLGAEPAGLYGAAYRVVWVPVMLASAHLTSVRPSFARAAQQGAAEVTTLLARTIRINVGLGIGIAVGAILLAEPLIDLLYGPPYRRAVLPFQILMGSFVLMLFSRPYRLLLATSNREWADLKTVSLAAAVSVALNVALIPRLGLEGAALTALLVEVVLLAGGYAAIRRLLGRVPFERLVMKPLLAAAVTAVVLLLSRNSPVLARVALGGFSYLLVALATGVIEPEELRARLRSWQTPHKRR